MLKRTPVIILSLMLLSSALGLQGVGAQTSEDTQLTARARARVQRLGTGEEARVEVRLRDKTKLKGYVSASAVDSFTMTEAKTGASKTVAYSEVEQVKKAGGGLRARTWVIIGASAAAALIIGLTVVKPVLCDSTGRQC